MATYDAGIVTAYGAAVRGGYTGTYEGFCAQQANYAQSAAAVAQAKSDAEAAAQDATESAEALSGSVAQIATNTQDISTLKEDKADIDGYYQDMTVGDAEQLVASQYVDDSVPYNFRTTGGSADVGNREYVDGIVGGSVVVNQLVKSFVDTKTINGVTFTANGGAITVSGTATSNAPYPLHTVPLFANHVYYLKGCPDGGRSGAVNRYAFYANETSPQLFDVGSGSMQKQTADTTGALYFIVYSGQTVDFTFIPQLFDVTQELGATVADYALSLETATAGAGVAWFKKLFPKDYYEYNAGELLSVSGLASHDTVGFNQWDEEWEVGLISISNGQNITGQGIRSKNMCKCFPNTQYHVNFNSGGSKYIFWYDVDGNYIYQNPVGTEQTFTSPNNARYFKIRVDTIINYNHNICINLSWSGWRNGEYEAYQKHSYPLDADVVLRGIPKLDSSNNLYYDGDEYLPDGSVNRRYGVVDLGTLEWHAISGYAGYFKAVTTEVVNIDNGVVANALCPKYVTVKGNDLASKDKVIAVGMNNAYEIQIGDSAYSTASASDFRNALAGVMLLYKKRLFTTETAEPYQHVQICDDFGTEEYVSTSIVPVGHNTRYPANLRDKLQHLPDLADDDGYYMIGQSNKQMHLELFRIPKAPTADGTYTLKATVSGGTPTYTWEAQT